MHSATKELTLFEPLCAFSWGAANQKSIWGSPNRPAPAPSKPIGQTPNEAKQAAWFLNLAAAPVKVSDQKLVTVHERLAFFVHLQRTEPRVSSIHKRLSALGATPCHLGQLECEIGDFWGEVTAPFSDGHERRIDTFHWRKVEAIVKESVSVFLRKLDEVISGLKGMEPLQIGAEAYDDCANARVVVANLLSKLLTDRNPNVDIVAEINALAEELVRPRLAAVRQRCRDRAVSVLALQKLATAASSNHPKADQHADAIIQNYYQDLCNVALDPPPELVDALSSRGVSLNELTDCFMPQSTIATCLRHDIIGHWAWRVGQDLVEACHSTLSVLRRLMDTVDTADEWSGLRIAQIQDPRVQEALSTQKFGIVAECPLPSHTATLLPNMNNAVLYAVDSGTETAVRTVRMLRALQMIVQAGLIPAYTVRADYLLPLFARVKHEQRAHYSSIASSYLENCGREHGVKWPCDSETDNSHGSDRTQQRPNQHEPPPKASMIPPAPVTRVVALSDVKTGAIPPELKRDYAILFSLAQMVSHFGEPRAMNIRPSQVAQVVTNMDPDLHKNPASLNQACGNVMRKIMRMCIESSAQCNQPCGSISYSQERPRGRDSCIEGLSLDTLGAQTLHLFVRNWIARMKDANKTVISQWAPSRASRHFATSQKRSSSSVASNGSNGSAAVVAPYPRSQKHKHPRPQ